MSKTTKIQRFAKGKPCMLRIPGVCRTTPDNEDCVLCHAPHFNRGGMRKDDWWGAVGCSRCHDAIDHRTMEILLTADLWVNAIYEWQAMLIEAGLIKVEGVEIGLPKQLPRRLR